ncbi:MAG: hypothetical protein ACYCXX_05530 [Acidiferrobacter thiooxydans]
MDVIEGRQGRWLPWRERRLKAWIDALPTAEPGRALALLGQSVRALNATLLDPVTRITLLRHYTRSAADLTAVLARPGNAGAVAGLATTLHSEMAQGYQMALTPELPADERRMAVAGAISGLSEVLRAAYRAYVPAPPGLWRRIHTLFQAAGAPTLGLERLYVNVLLMGLSDPYALPEGGIDAVCELIAEVGERAVLNETAGFAIVPEADRVAEPADSEASLYLDTGAVLSELARLRDDIRAHRPLPPRLAARVLPDLALRLCASLGETWRPGVRRRSLRVPLRGERLVCQGLASLRRLRAHDRLHQGFVDLDVPWGRAEAMAVNGRGAGLPRVTTWTIRDAGRSGLWLSCQGLEGPPPAPGTWIGVKDPSGSGQWLAATVRWLKRARPREYAIGVAVLAEAQTEAVLRIAPRRAAFAASPTSAPPQQPDGAASALTVETRGARLALP